MTPGVTEQEFGLSLLNDLQVQKDGELPLPLRSAALRVLAACVEGWSRAPAWSPTSPDAVVNCENIHAKPISMSKFHMDTLTGGMTNVVFRCEKPDGLNRVVLLRCYGCGTDAFFSREAEMIAFRHLAHLGLGPQLMGEFADGRVEEYLEAETLRPNTMRSPALSPMIAHQVAIMHSLRPTGLEPSAHLFKVMRKWQAMVMLPEADAHSTAADGGADTAAAVAAYGGAVDLAGLNERIDQLEARLARTLSPTVFCHNDLQYGNLMYKRPSGGPLYLIDYEYACFNPRGFDLGNHFCEWGADYHGSTPHLLALDRFPSAAEQELFCRAYLQAYSSSSSSSSNTAASTADSADTARSTAGTDTAAASSTAVTAAAVAALAREAREYSLASHLVWACWGLAQSRVSAIEFDYIGYAQGRIAAYDHFVALWGDAAP